MEVEVSIAIASGVTAVIIATIAGIVAVCSCKYARKSQSHTDEEATQVKVIHTMKALSFFWGCVKINKKKDNTYINNSTENNQYSTEVEYETKNNETANILAGGTGALHFGERALEVAENAYNIHTDYKAKRRKNEEERQLNITQDQSEQNNELTADNNKKQLDNVNHKGLASSKKIPINVATPVTDPVFLKNFLQCHNPQNKGDGSEKFTALLAQSALTAPAPKSPRLNEQDKNVVNNVATKWLNLSKKPKEKNNSDEKTKKDEISEEEISEDEINSTQQNAEIVGFKEEPETQITDFISPLPTDNNNAVSFTGANNEFVTPESL
ncbi:MAG: hypothetical protein EKK61_02475 [Rickettsiales bacterium]|nr:MAG: hypothetical protein EKK61_02475 [Rickettsiales bacterium]